ncbi:hypothetical protein ABT336_20620 [Micromonospora sp. NPDC000207]|uniref:hypothetical protein n=1 Tax=Micromonospora sp. NPDC000207 TaxID=3154246 RepID=UPI00332118B3
MPDSYGQPTSGDRDEWNLQGDLGRLWSSLTPENRRVFERLPLDALQGAATALQISNALNVISREEVNLSVVLARMNAGDSRRLLGHQAVGAQQKRLIGTERTRLNQAVLDHLSLGRHLPAQDPSPQNQFALMVGHLTPDNQRAMSILTNREQAKLIENNSIDLSLNGLRNCWAAGSGSQYQQARDALNAQVGEMIGLRDEAPRGAESTNAVSATASAVPYATMSLGAGDGPPRRSQLGPPPGFEGTPAPRQAFGQSVQRGQGTQGSAGRSMR